MSFKYPGFKPNRRLLVSHPGEWKISKGPENGSSFKKKDR
jgi:hypothetical protein